MTTERHQIYEQSIGAYLLGALDEAEAINFERHLDECHLCRDEVERLRPAAEALPRSVTPVSPPPELKAALMAEVEADLRERGAAPARPGIRARMREHLAGIGDSIAGMRPTVAWTAAAFVLAVGVLAGYGAGELTSEPGTRTLAATADERTVPFGSGSLLVPEDLKEGAILRVHGMPTLRGDSVYQVWVKRGDETISQSLFSVGEDGNGAAAVSDDLDDADAVMVTREPAGGARAPSEKPVLTVAL